MAAFAASMYTAMGDETTKSVHVRNTFIEIEEEEMPSAAKRTSSLPASFRLAQEDESPCTKKGLQLPFLVPRAGSSSRSTDGSSQDGALSDVDVSTEAPSELSSLQPVRTCLRSCAKAWNPCEEDPVLREIREGAETLRQAVMATGLAVSCEIVSDKNGGFEILAIATQDQALEGVLTMAKHTLLQWAESSSSIYVLGYCHRPFVPLLDGIGFVATMSLMEDTSCCCWDAYKWGYCKRGQQCRWQHPRRLVPLSLRIQSGMPCWPANGYCGWEEGNYQGMSQAWA